MLIILSIFIVSVDHGVKGVLSKLVDAAVGESWRANCQEGKLRKDVIAIHLKMGYKEE